MTIDYSLYPPNWKTEIRPRILARANHRCEWCGVANYTRGYREAGIFHPCDALDCDHRHLRIVLTIAHVDDRNPMSADDSNLAALCQRDHLNHDRKVRS